MTTTMSEEDENALYHYDDASDVPEDIQKYWHQRYSIFSKYDEGIWLTDHAWFGVTPESVAQQIAKHVAKIAPAQKTVLIDAFAGAGGSTIQFALSGRWERIFAVEKDPEVLKCAKRNAEIYGVSKKIWWIHGDCFDVLKSRFRGMGKEAVIFASPPWGGPGYTSDAIFDLSTMQPYSLDQIHTSYSKITKEIILYLPRTSNLNQIAQYAPEGKRLPVVHYCMTGASKALCAYYGDFTAIEETEEEQDL